MSSAGCNILLNEIPSKKGVTELQVLLEGTSTNFESCELSTGGMLYYKYKIIDWWSKTAQKMFQAHSRFEQEPKATAIATTTNNKLQQKQRQRVGTGENMSNQVPSNFASVHQIGHPAEVIPANSKFHTTDLSTTRSLFSATFLGWYSQLVNQLPTKAPMVKLNDQWFGPVSLGKIPDEGGCQNCLCLP